MDGELLHLVNDPNTPQRMAAAGVAFEDARWYSTIGRKLKRYTDDEVIRVMAIRCRVRNANVSLPA